MSNYFSYFPKTEQKIGAGDSHVLLTNIMRRFKIRSSIKKNTQVYHEYSIQEGERPDIIAHKYYGSSNYAWIILHYNNIVDPVFGWPLFGEEFQDYIKGKYGSIPEAKNEVHEYRKILTHSKIHLNGNKINERYVVIDLYQYQYTSPKDRKTVYKYDYELEIQEKKRNIKLLDKRYISKIRDEVETILRDGI